MFPVEDLECGVRFKVRVQPRASKNEISGVYQDMLKLRLTAPPVDGEANKACIEFFAKKLSLPKSSIRLVSGMKGRTKTLEIDGVTATAVFGLVPGSAKIRQKTR